MPLDQSDIAHAALLRARSRTMLSKYASLAPRLCIQLLACNFWITSCQSAHLQTWLRCASNAFAVKQQCTTNATMVWRQCTSNATLADVQCVNGATTTLQFSECGETAMRKQSQCSKIGTARQLNCSSVANVMLRECQGNFATLASLAHNEQRRVYVSSQEAGNRSVLTFHEKSDSQIFSAAHEGFNGVLVIKAGVVHTQGAFIYALISLLVMVARIREELHLSQKVVLELPPEHKGAVNGHRVPSISKLFTGESLNAVADAIGVELQPGRPPAFSANWDACIGRTLHLKNWTRDLAEARAAWRRELEDVLRLVNSSQTPIVQCASRHQRQAQEDREGNVFKKYSSCSRENIELQTRFFQRVPSWIAEVARQKRNGKLTLQLNVMGHTGSSVVNQALFNRDLAAKILRLLRAQPPPYDKTQWPQHVHDCAYYFQREGNTRSPKDTFALLLSFVAKFGRTCVYVNSPEEPGVWDTVTSSAVRVVHANKRRWQNEHEFFFRNNFATVHH